MENAEEAIPEPITSEALYQNEAATEASNGWLEKAGNKIKRWAGHSWRFLGTESVINFGTGWATFGVLGSVLTGNPLPLILTAGGAGLAGTGVAAQWEMGMQHAESETEKSVFKLAKLGQTVGTGTLIALAALGTPAVLPVALGMYYAGVGMGARSMAHRP